MSVARLNGSHADLAWHRDTVRLLRDTLPDVPILLDIPGKKIRTLSLRHEPQFPVGGTIVLTTNNSFDGHEKVPVNYDELHNDVKEGDIVLADDGSLRFEIDRVDGRDIVCRALTAGKLKSRKGINVPFVKINKAIITERDVQMVAFAKDVGVDFIGISFVESAGHVSAIRELVGCGSPLVLAKIENQGGLDHMDEIIAEADAIMIDRGDLSVETSLEKMAVYQKQIISAARKLGKPVVVATEMLHTMIVNNFPTKAEVSDISNAVFDGCSATMLSGETAMGDYPIDAVQTMRRVVDMAYANMDTRAISRKDVDSGHIDAFVDAIVEILNGVAITKVIVVTRSGFAARMLASRLIMQPILAFSDDLDMVRSFNLFAGVTGVYSDKAFSRGSADHIKNCIYSLYEQGLRY